MENQWTKEFPLQDGLYWINTNGETSVVRCHCKIKMFQRLHPKLEMNLVELGPNSGSKFLGPITLSDLFR